jgi:hypothetical protein
MGIIFEATDPRGYKVICTEEIWYGKILTKRPFMAGWEERVRRAIESPSLPIFQDATLENRHIYYRLSDKGSHRYIKVVVAFHTEESGRVISAYPCDSGKSGEKPIWPE